MYVSELEANYRTRFTDDMPQLHALSPEAYLDYLNEAQDEACIRANLIKDKSSSICTIDIITGTSVYAISPRIHGIAYASVLDASNIRTKLRLTTTTELDYDRPGWRDYDPDTPTHLIHDGNTIEVTPEPDAAYTLKLEVYRLGKKMTGDKSSPEIRENLHRALNYWVLHRMYQSPDEDVTNPTKAAENLIEFEKIFGTRPLAEHHADKYQSRPHRTRSTFI